MSISSLPPEILGQVFRNLDQETISTAAPLVCRAWLPLVREAFWSELYLRLGNEIPENLPPVLRAEGTSIPKHVKCIVIYDDDLLELDDVWSDGLGTILGHFAAVRQICVWALDMRKLPRPLFRPGLGLERLTLEGIHAGDASDLLPVITGNETLRFLQLGRCSFTNKDAAPDEPAQGHVPASLRHLVVTTAADDTWDLLLPRALSYASLTELETFVTVAYKQGPVCDILTRIAPSLVSLGLALSSGNTAFDLGEFASLRNLSFSIGEAGGVISALKDTVCSVPHLEYLFISLSPASLEADSQAEPVWAALDAYLAGRPGLREVVCLQMVSTCFVSSLPLGVGGGLIHDTLQKWEKAVADFPEARLPASWEKGLVRVQQIATDSWSQQPFGDVALLQ